MAKLNEQEKTYRLDKWLWAARFFKTRSIASDAVKSGKVRVNGERAKNAKEVQLGMVIAIKNRDFEIEVDVIGLSDIRRGAPEAALLYQETEASMEKKAQIKAAHASDFGVREKGAGRPTKRQLRQINQFKGYKY